MKHLLAALLACATAASAQTVNFDDGVLSIVEGSIRGYMEGGIGLNGEFDGGAVGDANADGSRDLIVSTGQGSSFHFWTSAPGRQFAHNTSISFDVLASLGAFGRTEIVSSSGQSYTFDNQELGGSRLQPVTFAGLNTNIEIRSEPGFGGYVVIDNVSFSAPVPEPGTYALMLAGLGMVVFMARRRKE